MKNFFVLILLLLPVASVVAQKAIFYHDGTIHYVVAPPTYEFDIASKDKYLTTISDPPLLCFLDSVVANAVVDDSCNCTTYITFDMTRIIFEKNDHKYYTINMTHYGYPYDYHSGCLEINGQIMKYNPDFQIVIDNIVNYYIHYKPDNKSLKEIVRAILNGKRYNLSSNLLLPPPPANVP